MRIKGKAKATAKGDIYHKGLEENEGCLKSLFRYLQALHSLYGEMPLVLILNLTKEPNLSATCLPQAGAGGKNKLKLV